MTDFCKSCGKVIKRDDVVCDTCFTYLPDHKLKRCYEEWNKELVR